MDDKVVEFAYKNDIEPKNLRLGMSEKNTSPIGKSLDFNRNMLHVGSMAAYPLPLSCFNIVEFLEFCVQDRALEKYNQSKTVYSY